MLLRSVENFLRRHRVAPTVFGRAAAGDPCLVKDMRAGRELRPPLDARVRGFMDGYALAQEKADVR